MQESDPIYNIIQSEKYPHHQLEIKKWIADSKEISNQIKSMVSIERETEKAYQIKMEKSQEEHWIPKSQCKIIRRTEAKLSGF